MNKKLVKNISDQELAIPNVGVVGAGQTIEVDGDFNNANFVEVKKGKEKEVESDKTETEIKKNK